MPAAASLIRWLAWFHRWSSIFLCLLFAMWFASGALMLFVPFPSLAKAAQLAHREPLDLRRVQVSPAAAQALAPQAISMRLISTAGQPVYVLDAPGQRNVVVDAISGRLRPALSTAAVRRIAEQFSGKPVAQIDADIEYDQWVVHQAFDAGRPYFRITLLDDAQTMLYVAARSGDVVQQTTRSQRLLNLGGAVLHWLYFTPVRQHWSFWDQLVWWLSLLALLGAAVGMGLGVYRFVQARSFGKAGLHAFRGWLRWHHVLGLCAGIFLLGWIFSGWLSMDHGRLFSRGSAAPAEVMRFQGRDLAQISAASSLAQLQAAPEAREVQFHAIAGHSFMLLRDGHDAAQLRFADGTHSTLLADGLLRQAAQAAWPDARIDLQAAPASTLYARAEDVADDVRTLSVTDHARKEIYVDAHSGDILAAADGSRRAYAWLYYALHTYQFPGLIAHDRLRISLMLLLLAAGFVLSLTGMVLAAKQLTKSR